MTNYEIYYEGKLRTKCIHLGNKSVIETDAPKDNHGRGEEFSPTDLVAVALGTCIMTIMGIAAEKRGVSLEGMRAEVSKEMKSQPHRQIGKIKVEIYGPALPEEISKKLEEVGHLCPVGKSLASDIVQEVVFHWG
jgi:putative redox protein